MKRNIDLVRAKEEDQSPAIGDGVIPGVCSVETHPREVSVARCTLDGVDITSDCYAANAADGWADCFARDATGHHFVQNGRVVRERRYGVVVIDFPKGLD